MRKGVPFAESPDPFTKEELVHIAGARSSFAYFLEHVFPASYDKQLFMMADGQRHPFSLSRIHYLWALLAEKYPRLCVMAPRLHLKSTVLNNAFGLWQLFRASGYVDGMVVSYKDDLAYDHVKIAKRLAKGNRYFRFFSDLKDRSEHVISFECGFGMGDTWQGDIEGVGVHSAKRGRHPKFVVADDILSDFANPLDPNELEKIDVIFNTVVQSLPAPDDSLILVGTPQSYEDTLYRLKVNPEFYWLRCPAEREPGNPHGAVAWQERFSYEVLQRVLARVLPRAYQVEYLLIPFMAVNTFLPRLLVEGRVDHEAEPWGLDIPFENPDSWPVYGGMDVGKEVHPSHISVAVQSPDGTLIQVYEEFLDHMNYPQQVRLVNSLIKHFNITKFLYDSTRAELDDRGLVKRAMGRKITKQLKGNLALLLERRIVEDPGVLLLPDARQVNQICAVDPLLKSIETSEGHGDSFWSNALMIKAAEEGPAMTDLGSVNEMYGRARFPRPPK